MRLARERGGTQCLSENWVSENAGACFPSHPRNRSLHGLGEVRIGPDDGHIDPRDSPVRASRVMKPGMRGSDSMIRRITSISREL